MAKIFICIFGFRRQISRSERVNPVPLEICEVYKHQRAINPFTPSRELFWVWHFISCSRPTNLESFDTQGLWCGWCGTVVEDIDGGRLCDDDVDSAFKQGNSANSAVYRQCWAPLNLVSVRSMNISTSYDTTIRWEMDHVFAEKLILGSFIYRTKPNKNKSVQSNLGKGPRRGAVAHVRREVPIGYNGAPQIRPPKIPLPVDRSPNPTTCLIP